MVHVPSFLFTIKEETWGHIYKYNSRQLGTHQDFVCFVLLLLLFWGGGGGGGFGFALLFWGEGAHYSWPFLSANQAVYICIRLRTADNIHVVNFLRSYEWPISENIMYAICEVTVMWRTVKVENSNFFMDMKAFHED